MYGLLVLSKSTLGVPPVSSTNSALLVSVVVPIGRGSLPGGTPAGSTMVGIWGLNVGTSAS